MPERIGEMYGLTSSPATIHAAQLFGVALVAVGLITFLARNSDPSVVKPIVMSLFIADVIGLIVEIKDTTGGVVNSMGWVSVALYAILALGFGYFAFIKKD